MSIYIDEEYDATTLEGLKQQALEVAERAWYRHVEDEALQNFRDLTREPTPPGFYDVVDSSLVDLWAKKITEQVTQKVPSFTTTDDKET